MPAVDTIKACKIKSTFVGNVIMDRDDISLMLNYAFTTKRTMPYKEEMRLYFLLPWFGGHLFLRGGALAHHCWHANLKVFGDVLYVGLGEADSACQRKEEKKKKSLLPGSS